MFVRICKQARRRHSSARLKAAVSRRIFYDLVDKRIAGELNSIGSLLGMLAAVLGSRR